MNKKVKIKILIDTLMAVLFLLLMNTAVTGVLMHEILGVAVLGLFIAHIAVNKAWLKNILGRIKTGPVGKQWSSLLLNLSTGIAASVTMASGVLISQYLFAPLNTQDIGLWTSIHDVSTWMTLALIAAHCVAHRRWIFGVIRQAGSLAGRAAAILARLGTAVMALATVLTLLNGKPFEAAIDSFSSGTQKAALSTQASNGPTLAPAPSASSSDGATVKNAGTAQSGVSLQEYLSKLHCTACHRHCPLSNPLCGRGVQQAEEQMVVYNSTYQTGE